MNKPLLRLSQVSFSYPDAPCLLKELDLTIEQGSFTVILGESGSGKSTLSRIMAQVMPEHEGKLDGNVYVSHETDGCREGDDKRRNHRASSLEALPSSPSLLVGHMGGELSSFVIGVVEDELAFGPANLGVDTLEIEQRMERELKRINMLDYRLSAVEQLSGGQQQQIAASSVWTMEPELLVMDDAWSHLDRDAKLIFADALLQWLEESSLHTLVMILPRVEQRDRAHPLWLRANWLQLKQGQLHPTKPFDLASSISKLHVCEEERNDKKNRNIDEQLQVPAIKLEDAGTSYPDLSFGIQADGELMPREAVLLQGENGSGKTTLLHLITQSLPLQHGAASVAGYSLSKLKPHELARLIGYVPQSSYAMFLYDTVQHELEFAYDSAIAIGREPYKFLGSAKPINENEGKMEKVDPMMQCNQGSQERLRTRWVQQQLELLGLTQRAGENPQELPAADRRMLNVIMATVHRPYLLVLDEPTAGLDECSASALIHYCEALRRQGTALIVATHDELWDRFAQGRSNWHIWRMDNGNLHSSKHENVASDKKKC
ncbi:ABC transporter ATP-binding protein [Paenibacillus sp. SC116]|uniref:ATP-binding cassette domain-containing protein n=1 Tax=Paenibacillus sp. SC116 TaxID=2968986 RepID=UPI00215A8EB4|nr:ABC transporter ATP-binding protein [Paenibacillus sp. SC116]MCR8845201.1 ABC transporter ATP-binding protein [Paenibacillus sp. SC116]